MLMAVEKNIYFLKVSLITNLKSIIVYKTQFLIESILMMVNNSFFILFWIKIFQNGNEITTFTFNDILSIWAISTISYGITYFFFEGVRYINRYIVDCTMDSFLLQPKNVLINVIVSRSDFSAFGDLLFGILVIIFVYNKNLILGFSIIFCGIFGSIFFLSTEIILRSISVWIGDTETLSDRYIHTLLTNFSAYPEQIFPKWLRATLYTIIPSGLISYLPINLLSDFSIIKLLVYFVVGIVDLLISVKIFNLAIRSYNSGNCFGLKI